MLERLLPWIGYDAPAGATRIVRASGSAQGLSPWLAALLAVLLGAAVWLLYRRERSISPLRRSLLAVTRIVIVAGLLLLLVQPVVRLELLGHVKRALIVLVDTSGSMNVIDPRPEAIDAQRLALVLGAEAHTATTSASTPVPISRAELVKAALVQPKLALLERLAQSSELTIVTFDRGRPAALPGADAAAVEAIATSNAPTALGDALRQTVADANGAPATGVLLITDGQSNAGSDAPSAARLAGRSGLPVFVWGVGTTAPPDAAVAAIEAPRVAFKDDQTAIEITLQSTGLRGRRAKVSVRLGDEEVATREVSFDADGPHVEVFKVTPSVAGEQALRVELAALEGEAVAKNNVRSLPLRVSGRKIRVLLVERQPRWDFKYLQAALLRDPRVELKCLLLEGDPQLAADPNSPYVAQFPADLKQLATYDLLILGDVGAQDIPPAQQQLIHDFVSRLGGGLAMTAGKGRGAGAWPSDSPIGRALPVVGGSAITAEGGASVERTVEGTRSGTLALEEDEVQDSRTWLALPPLQWVAPIDRVKPAAQTLAQTRIEPGGAQRAVPIIVIQQYGLGQTLYIGTDNLWRWRRNVGDRHYARLWGQIVQRLALPHLLGENKRTQLSTEQQSYEPGDTIAVQARLFDTELQPIVAPSVKAVVKDAAGLARELIFWPVSGVAGAYRAEFVAGAVGRYELSIIDSGETNALAIDVVEPARELLEIGMNEPLLRQMADQSGGVFVREEDLSRLPELIESRRAPIRSDVELQIWSSPLVFVVLLLLVSTEWLLRRLWQLK